MKRPNIGIFSLIAIAVILNCACKKAQSVDPNSRLIQIPSLGLSLNYEGWIYNDNPNMINQAQELISESDNSGTIKKALEVAGINFFLFEHPVGSPESMPFNTNINYTVEDLSNQPRKISLDDYISAATGLYPTVFQKYEMIKPPKKSKVHGMESALLESKFEQPLGNQILKLHNYQLVFIVNQKAHVFTGTFLHKEAGGKGPMVLDLFGKFAKL
ncbi:hypothetical protein AB3N59_01355 [Leptospira sp. WS92.C1]